MLPAFASTAVQDKPMGFFVVVVPNRRLKSWGKPPNSDHSEVDRDDIQPLPSELTLGGGKSQANVG